MIHELYANNDKFKQINFKSGLNIILADTTENKTEDSRNGLGKTTLLNIIHFCLGSKNYKDNLPVKDLSNWEFTITLDLFDEKISATRSFDNPFQIKVNGNCKNFPIKPKDNCYSIDSWKELLSQSLFGFISEDGFKYHPTYSMLLHYFVRKNNDFKSAFNNKNTSYKPINQKICTSFLLGLNWRLISKHKELTDEHGEINQTAQRLKQDYGSKGRIIPEINRLKKETKELSEELENFKVHSSYDQIKENADSLTTEIHDLLNESIFLEKKLQKYVKSIEEESVSQDVDLIKIYENSKVLLNDEIKNTLEESRKFNNAIIKNRKNFLKNEIDSLKTKIDEINNAVEKKSNKRSKYMDVLNNFGALKEYTQLQEIYLNKKQKINELEEIIEKYDEIASRKQRIKNELLNLESQFQINYEENKTHLNYLINSFSDKSSKLYEYPGNLIIESNEKGFEFNIEIPRINSDGKSKMIIFCYDLMLLEAFSKNNINFLIHDSNIFDGVDSRQIGSSLNLINEKDMQYICMLNSDIIPKQYLDFDICENVVLRLSDESIDKSLLGFEF